MQLYKNNFFKLKTLLLHLYEVKPKFGNNQWGFLYTTKGCEFNFVRKRKIKWCI